MIDRQRSTEQINQLSVLSAIIDKQNEEKRAVIETMIPLLEQLKNEKTGEIVQDIKQGLKYLLDL